MRFLRLFLVSCWLTAAVSCGGASVTTETGNPSTITRDLVSIVEVEDGLRVVGEPGAVVGDGDTLELVNATTGTRVTVTVAADGSFDVTIEGAAGDEIEINLAGSRVPLDGPMIIGVTRTVNP